MKQKRTLIILSLTILLIAGVGVAVWFAYVAPRSKANNPSLNNTQGSDSINYDQPTSEQVDAGNTVKKSTIDTDKAQTPAGSSAPVPITTTATAISPEKVSLRFMIDGLHKGSCSITLTGPNGATVSALADTQLLANTSTCQGFDIDTSRLSTGKWAYTMNGSFDNGRIGQVVGEFTL